MLQAKGENSVSIRSLRATRPVNRRAESTLLALLTLVAIAVLPATASAHIYWTHYSEDGGAIGRVNRDGSGIDPNFITGIGSFSSYQSSSAIAVDAAHIYWANGDSIGRAKLDGTGVEQNFLPADANYGLAVDAHHIYWTSGTGYYNPIGRANLDGTDVETEFVSFPWVTNQPPPNSPRGLATDAGTLYWASLGYSSYNYTDGGSTIGRAWPDPVYPGNTYRDPSFIGNANGSNYLNRPLSVAVDADYVYWANSPTRDFANATSIGRANLDGSGAQTLIYPAPTGVGRSGLAVDAGHVYWIQRTSGTNAIARANLDGTKVDGGFIPIGADQFYDGAIAVDPDTNPPETTIDSGPTGLTNDNTPTFTFSSSEARSTFECKVDGGPFEDCSGPGGSHTTFGLADGPHEFRVRATDEASNTDQSPVSRSFTVDTTAPDMRVTKRLKGKIKTKKRSVKIKVSFSSEKDAKFKCKLDKAKYKPCTSPYKVRAKSKRGKGKKHTISVKATDKAGNVGRPTKVKFKVIRKR